MATRIFAQFDTTPANVVADIKTQILTSDAWSNPAGQRVVATTTRGASMVVDLADAAATSVRMQLGVYRTTGLADKTVRYISWRGTGGATSDPIHVTVSAGKEHLWLSIFGPQPGEVNAEANAVREQFFVGDLAPYFAADTIATVLLAANTSNSANTTSIAHVSRNAADNASWVAARLGAVMMPCADSSALVNLNLAASSDGTSYFWPYVVVESTAGIRGRVSEVFHIGSSAVTLTGVGELTKLTMGTNTYIVYRPYAQGSSICPWGQGTNSNPLIAVPYS